MNTNVGGEEREEWNPAGRRPHRVKFMHAHLLRMWALPDLVNPYSISHPPSFPNTSVPSTSSASQSYPLLPASILPTLYPRPKPYSKLSVCDCSRTTVPYRTVHTQAIELVQLAYFFKTTSKLIRPISPPFLLNSMLSPPLYYTLYDFAVYTPHRLDSLYFIPTIFAFVASYSSISI